MTDITWTPTTIVDKEFVWIKSTNTLPGAISQTDTSNPNFQKTHTKTPIQYHSEFKVLSRIPNAYVGTNGKILMMNSWIPEFDADVKYLEDNFDRSPIGLKSFLTNVHFDWDKRIWSRVMDVTLRPVDVWVDANMDWSMRYGGMLRFELLTEDTVLYATPSRDEFAWRNKTIKLENLTSIVYNRPVEAQLAYIAVIGGAAKLNGEDAPLDTVVRVQSESVTIENVSNPVILVREKYVTN
jgi:hypothetical protein